MKRMRSLRLALSLLIFYPLVLFAQTEPILVEAESGTVGADFTAGTLDGANYIAINSTDTNPPTTARMAAYTVTFPSAGAYELYARFRVGPQGGSDDSWFAGNGFGLKGPVAGDWTLLNQVDGGGYTAPDDTVLNGGPATTNAFKWFKVTGFAGPSVWTVPDGSLTQTFSFGGREDGLFMDKFAFGRQGSYYTVSNLSNGTAASGTPPPPPPPPPAYTPSGPPLATGQAKFLGSAHSPAQNRNFTAYWNQVTPENGGKWASVEATRDVMNWTEADAAYNLARSNGFVFKWHVLIWGNQQPNWMNALAANPAQQLEEIDEWMAAIAARYPDLEQIEVVNEPLHDPPCTNDNGGGFYCNALGGAGVTGWDWIIKAFEMARAHFPNAKLMLNDYSIANDGNATTRYLQIIQLLKDRNLIDLIGIQGHAFSTTEAAPMTNFRANIDRLAATGLPIYVTELDIDGNDDPVQLASYQRIFPTLWEHPAIKGVTLWGFNRGHWRTAQGAWLAYDNGAERPALQCSTPTSVTVNLVNGNDNTPAITPAQNLRIDGGVRNVVGKAAATDADDANEPGFTTLQNWQITGGNGASLFAIDPSSGAIRAKRPTAIDFRKSSYALTASVSDGLNTSAPQSITIRIANQLNVCLLVVDLRVPKPLAPLLLKFGGSLGSCRAH